MIQVNDTNNSTIEVLAIDLTAMMDILFIVLVFFMLTSNPALRALEIALPSKGIEQAEAISQTKNIIELVLYKELKWSIGEQQYSSWEETRNALVLQLQADNKFELIISSARDANVERLMEVMAFLKEQNLQTTQIQMEKSTR